MRKSFNKGHGQALIEFLLMLVISVSIVMLLGTTFRKTITAVWGYYTKQVTAPCPGCPADSRYRFR